MATRARKPGTSSGQSGRPSDASPPAGSSASLRSPSPVMVSRVEEKNELAALNDRLAVYIDRMRHLEADNKRLTQRSSELEETVRREVDGVKSLYDREIAEARRLLDQQAQEKAKCQLEVNKLQSQLEDLKAKYLTKAKSEEDLQQRILAAEAQINELKTRLNESNNKKKYVENENARLAREMESMSRKLADAERDHEAEVMKRSDYENRIKTIQKELSLQAQVHKKEMEDATERHRIAVTEIDTRLQQQYENQQAEALQQIRDESNEIIRRNREEVEAFYEKRLSDGQSTLKKSQDAAQKAQIELQHSRKRCEDLTAELSRQNAQVSTLKSRLEQLELQLRKEQDEHHIAVAAKDAEIDRLKRLVEDQLREYRDLLDVKIQLDTEIAAYRKLLELEESRLNMSSSASTSGTTEASFQGSRKRRLVDSAGASPRSAIRAHSHGSLSASASYVTVSSADVGIEIQAANAKFIRLYNNGDKNISLPNWYLKQTTQTAEVVYKFVRGAAIKPLQYLTIWSQDSGPSNPTSADIIMRSQSWLETSDMAKIVLVSAEEKEVASRERSRGLHTSSAFSEDSGIERGTTSSSWRITSLFTAFM